MSRGVQQRRRGRPAPKRGVAILGGVLLLTGVGLVFLLRRAPIEPNQPATEPVDRAPVTAAAATAHPATNEIGFSKLPGRWHRPDGGYVLEIRSVGNSGRLEAGYFNPQPIHVARAEAARDGSTLKVMVELRDVNYPGSTYQLRYDPATDQLQGTYYQAALQQQFDVFFERAP